MYFQRLFLFICHLICFCSKVAQTRLEHRTHRPNVELCRDIPQYHLCYEVGEIDGSIKALIEKLQTAESALESLQRDLARIEEDLAIKTNSLALDNRCMEIRKKLKNTDLMPDQLDEVTDKLSRLHPKEEEQMSPGQDVIDHDTTEFTVNENLVGNNHSVNKLTNEQNVKTEQHTKTGSQQKQKSLLETTYNASFKTYDSNLRSGDLARTLGRSQEGTTKAKRDILID